MERYKPNSAEATRRHFQALDEAEVREAQRWTPDMIRDHHANMLEAQAQQPDTLPSVYEELMTKARIARADAEALRSGGQPSTPSPPSF